MKKYRLEKISQKNSSPSPYTQKSFERINLTGIKSNYISYFTIEDQMKCTQTRTTIDDKETTIHDLQELIIIKTKEKNIKENQFLKRKNKPISRNQFQAILPHTISLIIKLSQNSQKLAYLILKIIGCVVRSEQKEKIHKILKLILEWVRAIFSFLHAETLHKLGL